MHFTLYVSLWTASECFIKFISRVHEMYTQTRFTVAAVNVKRRSFVTKIIYIYICCQRLPVTDSPGFNAQFFHFFISYKTWSPCLGRSRSLGYIHLVAINLKLFCGCPFLILIDVSITCQLLYPTCHMTHHSCPLSHDTCLLSPVTRHISHLSHQHWSAMSLAFSDFNKYCILDFDSYVIWFCAWIVSNLIRKSLTLPQFYNCISDVCPFIIFHHIFMQLFHLSHPSLCL